MTDDEIARWNARIDEMNQHEMCRLWRFATPGHPVFNRDLPLYDRFKARFDLLGGFTPEISKAIGWGEL